ncbi:leucine-rich repeat-containing protein 15-like [Drosophila rhopaloa]|uniref:Uncharacterized protein n=1 Tax=Drosophila rhopaloa TaxID=1041015 RepID=A0ABM5J6W3_DRORH|nr:leucine-rich repeat-containing protein 15-like [Drosophila rhopaloa]
MGYFLYTCILLLPVVIVLGNTDSELLCHGDNCTKTSIDNFPDPRANMLNARLYSCDNIGILKRSPNLISAMIDNCNTDYIDMADFSSLTKLTCLILQRGKLTELGDEQFSKMPTLKTLELRNNSIVRISVGAFKGIPEVWRLDMQHNEIVSLPTSVFHPLQNLIDLNLRGNKIVKLQYEIFDQNPHLLWLSLQDNPLTNVLSISLKHLVRLNLINCGPLKELHMESAETVNLRDTWIRRLDIDGGVNSLFLRKNRLEHIQIEDKLAVTLMDLNDNLLRTEDLQNILMGMWRLQFLDLSCNLISELPVPKRDNSSEVFLLPSLQFLNLSFNMLEYLHGDSPLISPGLRKLDLSHNSIRIIDPHIFRTVNNLQSLHIEWNSIRNFRYDRFYSQHRGLKELALYANVFSNKTYSIITKFFKDAGVKVIEKIYDSRVLPESESFTESEDSTEVSLQL